MQSRQPIEAGRPAKSMPIARRYILERLLNERETGATRNRLKCHADLGLVTAFAVIPFPCPCEDQPAWPINHAVETADREGRAARFVHDGAPAPTGPCFQTVDRALVPIRCPPSHQCRAFGPQLEEILGATGYHALE
jgi:hypothetical protein